MFRQSVGAESRSGVFPQPPSPCRLGFLLRPTFKGPPFPSQIPPAGPFSGPVSVWAGTHDDIDVIPGERVYHPANRAGVTTSKAPGTKEALAAKNRFF